ncbi:MAG: DEAD/DEAH box helicase [Steroidobacter sp.]
MFLWGEHAERIAFAAAGKPDRIRSISSNCTLSDVDGVCVPLLDALPSLAAFSAADLTRLPASISVWSLAAKLALELVARGRIVPFVESADEHVVARWRISLAAADDAQRVSSLAKTFPFAAHAVPVEAAVAHSRPKKSTRTAVRRDALHAWAADALLERFLDASADAIVRSATRGHRTESSRPSARARAHIPWETRLKSALSTNDPEFAAQGFAERSLVDELRRWVRPLTGAQRGDARAAFRLQLPKADESDRAGASSDRFTLQFLLQSASDPSLLIPAGDVFRGAASVRRGVAKSVRAAQESLLAGLATAARLFPAIGVSLSTARPERISLSQSMTWQFLQEAAPQLIEAGFGVLLPSELTRTGQRRLRMKMRLGGARMTTTSDSGAGLALDEMLKFTWDAELAGESLSAKELRELAQLKSPLVQFRGRWVAVEAGEIAEALRLLDQRDGELATHEALAAALGVAPRGVGTSLAVDVAVEGSFAQTLTNLNSARETAEFTPPATFIGELRPYQRRGAAWLATMAQLGLGACLADDMGLGKTIQLIAMLLEQRQSNPGGPVLLVCPTSVVGNWERELTRFGPSMPVVQHYGATRARDMGSFAGTLAPIVLTTYGLLRRDVELLASTAWSVVALDEAQNIKNASSRTAQAARSLRAQFRVALTGTPVENRLAELWSILEFLNPSLLGPQAEFRREYAIPIERYGQADAAERLRRVTQPFILRRLKSDPAIIQDLPPKQEMKVICSLTREQASLYQAALDDAMRRIEESEGIERRGLVLALLTALKQICNHPAHYLGEAGPLHARSGKLQRTVEMLEEVLAAGDRALIFTQYREMGERLVTEIARVFGVDAPFLHGGVARAARDAMVRRFQENLQSPAIFVLSLKAGGAGLNLTAANHVFHFDRWWNPAVEDQATDRAYRIGQHRTVQVHKLLCAGTVEEKVDELLERKRDLAASVIGGGEHWITELDNAALRDLFSLSANAVVAGDVTDSEEAGESARTTPARKRRRRSAPA